MNTQTKQPVLPNRAVRLITYDQKQNHGTKYNTKEQRKAEETSEATMKQRRNQSTNQQPTKTKQLFSFRVWFLSQ